MPIDRYPREAEGKGRPENQAPKGSVISRESPRVAIPSVLLRVIAILEDNLEAGPSAQRVALKDMAFKLCQAHPYLKYPWGRVDEIEEAQWQAEQDGEAHDGF